MTLSPRFFVSFPPLVSPFYYYYYYYSTNAYLFSLVLLPTCSSQRPHLFLFDDAVWHHQMEYAICQYSSFYPRVRLLGNVFLSLSLLPQSSETERELLDQWSVTVREREKEMATQTR
jgi:hypothetical protein